MKEIREGEGVGERLIENEDRGNGEEELRGWKQRKMERTGEGQRRQSKTGREKGG